MSIKNFIYSWIQNISILFIIISLIDLIMPKGSMRRYINFVIGLLIIFTVINPFMNLGKIDFNLDKEVFKSHQNTSPQYIEELIREQNNQVEELYREKIVEEVKESLKKYEEFNVSDVYIDIQKDEENYGDIKYMKIALEDESQMKKKTDNINIKVDTIGLQRSRDDSKELHKFNGIKKDLANRFYIDESVIDIIINKGGE